MFMHIHFNCNLLSHILSTLRIAKIPTNEAPAQNVAQSLCLAGVKYGSQKSFLVYFIGYIVPSQVCFKISMQYSLFSSSLCIFSCSFTSSISTQVCIPLFLRVSLSKELCKQSSFQLFLSKPLNYSIFLVAERSRCFESSPFATLSGIHPSQAIISFFPSFQFPFEYRKVLIIRYPSLSPFGLFIKTCSEDSCPTTLMYLNGQGSTVLLISFRSVASSLFNYLAMTFQRQTALKYLVVCQLQAVSADVVRAPIKVMYTHFPLMPMNLAFKLQLLNNLAQESKISFQNFGESFEKIKCVSLNNNVSKLQMTEIVLERVNQFLTDHQSICFTNLIEEPIAEESLNLIREHLQNLTKKQNLLREAYTLIRQFLYEYNRTQYAFQADFQELQQEISKMKNAHISEVQEFESLLTQHLEKERHYEKQLFQSNEQRQNLFILKEEKEQECQSLSVELNIIKESFKGQLSLYNEIVQQLEKVRNSHNKLLKQLELKTEEISIVTFRNEKLSERILQIEHELLILAIQNRQLNEEIQKQRNELERKDNRNLFYEAMIKRTQRSNKSTVEKQNVKCSINFECNESFSGFNSPKHKCNLIRTNKISDKNSSNFAQREHLNQIEILKSGSNGMCSKQNIQQKLLRYLSPLRQTNVTQFDHTKEKNNTTITEIDPYYCFFILLTQCTKLNEQDFQLAVSIDLNDLWDHFLNQRVAMNLWIERIQQTLKGRMDISQKEQKTAKIR